jgi:hypothetical protein
MIVLFLSASNFFSNADDSINSSGNPVFLQKAWQNPVGVKHIAVLILAEHAALFQRIEVLPDSLVRSNYNLSSALLPGLRAFHKGDGFQWLLT